MFDTLQQFIAATLKRYPGGMVLAKEFAKATTLSPGLS